MAQRDYLGRCAAQRDENRSPAGLAGNRLPDPRAGAAGLLLLRFGKSPIQRAPRFALAIGAPVIYLGIAALLLFFIS